MATMIIVIVISLIAYVCFGVVTLGVPAATVGVGAFNAVCVFCTLCAMVWSLLDD